MKVTLYTAKTGLGPSGSGVRVQPGTYDVVVLDGVDPDILYLRTPGTDKGLLGCIQRSDADEVTL